MIFSFEKRTFAPILYIRHKKRRKSCARGFCLLFFLLKLLRDCSGRVPSLVEQREQVQTQRRIMRRGLGLESMVENKAILLMHESKAVLLTRSDTVGNISACYRLHERAHAYARSCTPRGRLDFAENSNAGIVSIPQIGASADHSNYASALFVLARENS